MNQPTDITDPMAPHTAIQPASTTSKEREPDMNAVDIAAIELGLLKKFVAFLERQQRARKRSRKRSGNVKATKPLLPPPTPANRRKSRSENCLPLSPPEAKRRASMKTGREFMVNADALAEDWARMTTKYREYESDGKWSKDDPDIQLVEELKLLTKPEHQPKYPHVSATTN